MEKRYFWLALGCFALGFAAHAQEYEPGTERGVEVTEEQKDGKKTTKIREGKVKAYSEREVGKISPEDASRLETRRRALRLWSFGFGPQWSTKLKSDALMYGVMVGRHWDVHEHAEIRAVLTGAMAGGLEVSAFDFALGASFFPLTQDVTPFIGAALGGGVVTGKGVTDSGGFSASGSAGLRFFRTSDTQLEAGFRYLTILGKDVATPNIYGVYLSVLFN